MYEHFVTKPLPDGCVRFANEVPDIDWTKSTRPPPLLYPDSDNDEPMADASKGTEAKAGDQVRSTYGNQPGREQTVEPVSMPRASREILPEIVQLLHTLRNELGIALDQETRHLTEKIERQSWRMMAKGAYPDDPETMRDEDVEMSGEEEGGRKDPVPAYSPTSPNLNAMEKYSDDKASVDLRLEELEGKVKEVEKEMRENEWRVERDRGQFDERMTLMEARLAVLEVRPVE